MIRLDTPQEVAVPFNDESQAVVREARRRQRRRRVVTGGIVVVVLLGAMSVALVVRGDGADKTGQPSRNRVRPGSPAGGTLLRGSPRALASGQWLHTRAATTFSMDGLPLGVAGEITIPALTQSWANSRATCAQVSFGVPQFSSLTLRLAWIANGLSTNPRSGQPNGFCEENTPGGGALAVDPKDGAAKVLTKGLGVIDVSSLSSDPPTLARELTSGHTWNEMFDEAVPQRSYPNPGFERAVLLLQTPLLGATGNFYVALLRALPLIPGVVALGHQHSASGLTGLGFAADKGRNQASVILNPRTGQLEETRNVPAGSLFFSVGTGSFWNPYAPHVSDSSPSSLSLRVLRSDPIGNQAVVNFVPPFGFPA